jgi:hypothetical protein
MQLTMWMVIGGLVVVLVAMLGYRFAEPIAQWVWALVAVLGIVSTGSPRADPTEPSPPPIIVIPEESEKMRKEIQRSATSDHQQLQAAGAGVRDGTFGTLSRRPPFLTSAEQRRMYASSCKSS